MTRAQQVALSQPCVEAEDCVNPVFKHYAPPWSIILTMNVGFE